MENKQANKQKSKELNSFKMKIIRLYCSGHFEYTEIILKE